MRYPDDRVAVRAGVKQALLWLGILAVLGAAIVLGKTVLWRQTVTETHPAYFYKSASAITSTIYLKPNGIYAVPYLQGDKLCPRALTDAIRFSFVTDYAAQGKALLSMDYTVDSVVSGEMENQQALWSHATRLRTIHTKPAYDTTLRLDEVLPLKLDAYEAFARQAIAETGVSPPHVTLTVMLHGTLTAETAYGTLLQPVALRAEVPLLQPMYSVETDAPAAAQGHLSETATVRRPISRPLAGGCAAVLCTGIGLVLFLLRCTRTPTRDDRIEGRVRRILRQYRRRIVALRGASDTEEYYTQYEVGDMADLLRVSKETERPVFYLLPTDHTQTIQGNCFYVQTAAARFLYHIE